MSETINLGRGTNKAAFSCGSKTGSMETARQRTAQLLRESGFPTEWTMVDEANLRQQPQLAAPKNEEAGSGEEIEEKKTPLVAHACASG